MEIKTYEEFMSEHFKTPPQEMTKEQAENRGVMVFDGEEKEILVEAVDNPSLYGFGDDSISNKIGHKNLRNQKRIIGRYRTTKKPLYFPYYEKEQNIVFHGLKVFRKELEVKLEDKLIQREEKMLEEKLSKVKEMIEYVEDILE